MSVPPKGNYSQFVRYNEAKRYYVMQAQKNVPLLDAEVREMNESLLTLLRRSTQKVYGDLASPSEVYSSPGSGPAFAIKQSSVTPLNNFTISGGAGVDYPSVIFYQGYYVFFKGDVEYNSQNDVLQPGETVEDALQRDNYTSTPIPALTTPGASRTDCVYVDLSFAEVSAKAGSEYEDPSIKDPVVGAVTQNRKRAVIDIRVFENWSGATDATIFDDAFFGESLESQVVHYKFPIALIRRESGNPTITDAMITDLLYLHDKRVFSNKELSHRVQHGGYTQRDVDAGRAVPSDLDESAGATGRNEGLGTEAYNSNSVTPRVLDSEGKFLMDSLLVGATGAVTDDPENLESGEVASSVQFANQIIVNTQKGLTGARETAARVCVDTTGSTGPGVAVITGETGIPAFVAAKDCDSDPDFVVTDKGWVGINTGATGPVTPIDVGGDATVRGDVRAEGQNCDWGTVEGYGPESDTKGYSIGRGNSCTGMGPLLVHMDGVTGTGCSGIVSPGFTGVQQLIADVKEVSFELFDANLFSFYGTTRFAAETVFEADSYFGTDVYVDGTLLADAISTPNVVAKRVVAGSDPVYCCSELEVYGQGYISDRLLIGIDPCDTGFPCSGSTTVGTTTGTTVPISDSVKAAINGDVQADDFIAVGADGSYGYFAIEDCTGKMAAWLGGDDTTSTSVGLHLIDVDTFVFDSVTGDPINFKVAGSLETDSYIAAGAGISADGNITSGASITAEVDIVAQFGDVTAGGAVQAGSGVRAGTGNTLMKSSLVSWTGLLEGTGPGTTTIGLWEEDKPICSATFLANPGTTNEWYISGEDSLVGHRWSVEYDASATIVPGFYWVAFCRFAGSFFNHGFSPTSDDTVKIHVTFEA